MKAIKLLIISLFLFGTASAQSLIWSGTPAVTIQNSTNTASKQLRFIWGANIYSLPDTVNKYAFVLPTAYGIGIGHIAFLSNGKLLKDTVGYLKKNQADTLFSSVLFKQSIRGINGADLSQTDGSGNYGGLHIGSDGISLNASSPGSLSNELTINNSINGIYSTHAFDLYDSAFGVGALYGGLYDGRKYDEWIPTWYAVKSRIDSVGTNFAGLNTQNIFSKVQNYGDSTKARTVTIYGTSLLYPYGFDNTWQYSDNYGYKLAQLLACTNFVNQGGRGRYIIEVAPGDGSIEDGSTSFPQYKTGDILLIEAGGINDAPYSISHAQYSITPFIAALNVIIANARAKGFPNSNFGFEIPCYWTAGTSSVNDQFVAACDSVATANGILLFDGYTKYKSKVTSGAWVLSSGLHPTSAVHTIIAAAMDSTFSALNVNNINAVTNTYQSANIYGNLNATGTTNLSGNTTINTLYLNIGRLLAGDQVGDIPARGASGYEQPIPAGATNYFLRSNGAGTVPSWSNTLVSPSFTGNLSGNSTSTAIIGQTNFGTQQTMITNANAGIFNTQTGSGVFPFTANNNLVLQSRGNSSAYIVFATGVNGIVRGYIDGATGDLNWGATTGANLGYTIGVTGTLGVTGATTFGGKINLYSGTNGSSGTVTLSAGVATVSNTSVTANSIIIITSKGTGSSDTYSYTVTAGSSFTIYSANGTGTDTVGYIIIN